MIEKLGSWVKKYTIWVILFLGLLNYAVYELYSPHSIGVEPFPLKQAWSTTVGDGVQEIVIDNDRVLARSNYMLNALDLKTGKLLWKHYFDEKTDSAFAKDGIIYILASKTLYAFSEEADKIKWQSHIDSTGGGDIKEVSADYILVNFSSSYFSLYEYQSGKHIWDFPAGRGSENVCIYADKIYTFDDYVQVYDLSSKRLLKEDKTIASIGGNTCKNGVLYFSQDGEYIVAYDLLSQSVLWHTPITLSGPWGLATFKFDGDYLLVDDDTDVYILNPNDGSVAQHIRENLEAPTSPQIIGNNLFVFFGFDRTIYSYNLHTRENSGILRVSPPVFTYIDQKILNHKDGTLIFWKDKTIFAYK